LKMNEHKSNNVEEEEQWRWIRRAMTLGKRSNGVEQKIIAVSSKRSNDIKQEE
jgi:hypothetical protein